MTISSEVVSVAITLSDRAPTAANFGVPAIFCNAPYIGGRTYELSPEGLAEMVTDGFATSSRGYELAALMAGQSPHTENVVVYNRTTNFTHVIDLTPVNVTVGYVYEFTVEYAGVSSDISYTVVTGTVDAICDGIEALLDASPAGVAGFTSTPDNATATKLTLTAGTAGNFIKITGHTPSALKLKDVSTDAGIATDLAAAAVDNEFYAFVIDSASELENNAAAAWAEANKKLFFAQSNDQTDIVDAEGTGQAADFLAALYNRATVVYPPDAAPALVGRQLSQDPGTSSYAFKTLAGAEAVAVTSTQLANAKGKNVLLYALNNGTAHTWFGKAASGRSLRVQTAIDLIEARIQEAVLAVFLNAEFVPYSQRGFSQMEAAVRSVLSFVESQGIVSPGWTVTVPIAADQSLANKAAGLLDSLRFNAVIPGDVLKVVVRGSVTL
jgi:hypothetical protein